MGFAIQLQECHLCYVCVSAFLLHPLCLVTYLLRVGFFSVVSIFCYQEKSKNLDLTDADLNSKFIVTRGSHKIRGLLEM